jgi:hypothetical protein
MQKARTEAALDKLVRSDGVLYTKKDFIFHLLLTGYAPIEKLNEHRYARNSGEKLDPKLEYRMQDNDVHSFYVITKTEYDFARYLTTNALTSDEAAKRFMDAEQERLLNEQREREAQEQMRLEQKQSEKLEKEAFSAWLSEQASSYSNTERLKLMEAVFLGVAGLTNPRADLLVLIENLDNPRCKAKLISWLHMGNKASRKTFECVTGLKLPKTAKATAEYLSLLSVSDYRDSAAFKPRKKASEPQMETFYILGADGFNEVLAQPLSKYGMQLFIVNQNNWHKIYEARSGVVLVSGATKTKALDELKKAVEKHTAKVILDKAQSLIARNGLSPRYADDTKGAA